MNKQHRFIIFYALIVITAIAMATSYYLVQLGKEARHRAEIEQEQGIKTFWRLVQAKGGKFRVDGETMYLGNTVLNGNYELPDTVSSIFGGTATIFRGDTRITTSVRRADGSRAVGTRLDGPAFDAVFGEGRPYRGEASILGTPYFAAYDPIKDERGTVIGALYVGTRKSDFLELYGHTKRNVIISAALITLIFTTLAVTLLANRRRSDEALRDSEEKYRAVFETTGTATVIIEEDTTLSLVNEEFVRLSGYSREEIEGRRSWTEFVTDDHRERMMDYHRARRRDAAAAPDAYEFDFVDRYGVVRNILTNVKMIPGTGRSVMSYQDVTAQKRSRRLLEGEQRIMELIANEAPLGEILERICLTIEGQLNGGICSILLADAGGTRLRHGAAPSLPDDYNRTIDGTRIGPDIGSCGTAAHERRQVIVADIATDLRWAKYRQLPLSRGLQACWSTPVFASTGELLGTFALYYRAVRQPTEEEQRQIERAANLASIAIERAREKETLETNLRLLKVLIDTIPSPVYYKNAAGIYLACNRAFLTTLGVREDEVIGKTLYDLFPGEVAETYTARDRQLLASPCVQTFEATVTWGDGPHEVMFSKAAFCHPDGRPEGIVGVIVDITAVKEAERAVRALQRQQRAILDNIPDIAWLKDTESRFVAVNEAFARACNTSPAALVGKTDLDIWPAELAERYREDDRQVMASRQQKRIEEPLEDSTGNRFWIETMKMPVIDEQGAVVGTSGIARDIEGRKRAEEALRESEERFREIFEQNEDAILLLRRESFDVIDANPAAERLFGYTRDELGRLGPWSVLAPGKYHAFIAAVPPPGGETIFHIDRLGNVCKSGEEITVSIWGKIILLRREEVIYCSIRDITDRIRIEEEARLTQARLIHANKMTSLGVLVSGIAHEINNPNTFIQGNAGILEKAWLDVIPLLARQREATGEFSLGGLPSREMEQIIPRLIYGLKEGSRRISAIVGNLKDFAREDTTSGHGPIDVNKIVSDATLILSHHIHRHTDHFRLELADDLPPAKGKAQQVEQVVINLVMNGLQALTRKEAKLTVTTRADREASAVVIAVQDEGEGMNRETMAHLTEPFFSTRLERGGTGLGLSICASIIREHNGSLNFESAPGEGTTVTVTLPMPEPARR